METTDGARVIAAGVEVTIAGEEHRLRFGAQALEIIEEEFDGLLHFTTALNGGYKAKRFKAIRVGLLAGLSHEPVVPLSRKEQVARLMDSLIGEGFADVERIHFAIVEAFNQAIPPPPADKRASKASGQAKDSPGVASSGKRSSSSTSQQVSSAA